MNESRTIRFPNCSLVYLLLNFLLKKTTLRLTAYERHCTSLRRRYVMNPCCGTQPPQNCFQDTLFISIMELNADRCRCMKRRNAFAAKMNCGLSKCIYPYAVCLSAEVSGHHKPSSSIIIVTHSIASFSFPKKVSKHDR